MSLPSLRPVLAALALAGASGSSPAAIVAGHVDTFEDGTTQGWTVGAAAASVALPVNVATGGPGGADDNYLRLTSLGSGSFIPSSRLTAFNLGSVWTGDYLAAGITSIQLDAINLSANDLALRLFVANPLTGPPSDAAYSSLALSLPSGGGWTRLEFSLAAADLSALFGSVDDALSSVTMLRIFHSTASTFPGEPLDARLGLDNITAVGNGTPPPPPPPNPMPEPASWLLLATALWGAGVAPRLLRRRRSAGRAAGARSSA